MADETTQTILGHLIELRRRVMWSALAVAITTTVSFIFINDIFNILTSIADDLTLQVIEMTEMLGTYFRVAFFSGLAMATPVIIIQLVLFINPALTKKEKRYLYTLLPGILIAFAIGVTFAYYVMIPPAINFLINFGSDIAEFQIRVGNYISVVTGLILAIGICFESPIVIYFLTRIGVLTVKKLTKYRRFSYVGAFIIAAIITPTFDPINQSIVAVPLMVLYEIGILLARIAQRGREKTS